VKHSIRPASKDYSAKTKIFLNIFFRLKTAQFLILYLNAFIIIVKLSVFDKDGRAIKEGFLL